MSVAFTVQDARQLQACQLRLVHRKLPGLPDVAALTNLTSLDLSDNPIKALQPQCLPVSLKELVVAGCQLSDVPPSLTRLTGLEQLVLSANNIARPDSVFACQHLLHANLAYNHISSLITSSSVSRSRAKQSISSASTSVRSSCSVLDSSQVMCLDLSHNDITDLSGILQQLQQLPKLRALTLKGNPISVLSHYKHAVLQQIKHLVYLDGQKLDDLRVLTLSAAAAKATASNPPPPPAAAGAAVGPGHASSPPAAPPAAPSTGAAAAEDAPAAAAGNAALPDNTVRITLELDQLQVIEPADAVFKALTAAGSAQLQHLLEQQGHAASRPATAAEGQTGWSAASLSSANITSGSNAGSTPDTARTAPSSGGLSSTGAASSSGGSGGSSACVGVPPAVPLLPVRYHLEVCGPDGAGYCSTAMVVQPPSQSAADGGPGPGASPAGLAGGAAADPKKAGPAKPGKPAHADSSKAAATSRGRPGSSARPSGVKGAAAAADLQQSAAAATDTGASPTCLQPGRLRVQLVAQADVATRDWLRTGFDVKLMRTCLQPQPVLPPPAELLPAAQADSAVATAAAAPPPAAAPAKSVATGGAKATSKAVMGNNNSSSSGGTQPTQRPRGNSFEGAAAAEGAESGVPLVTWQQVPKYEELGSCRVCAPALVEGTGSAAGQPLEAAGSAAFIPAAPLLHPVTHIRLALEEAQHLQQQSTGSCAFRVVLHS